MCMDVCVLFHIPNLTPVVRVQSAMSVEWKPKHKHPDCCALCCNCMELLVTRPILIFSHSSFHGTTRTAQLRVAISVHSPIQWEPWANSSGIRGCRWCCHIHLVSTVRIPGAIPCVYVVWYFIRRRNAFALFCGAQPNAGLGHLIVEVTRYHTHTHTHTYTR